MRQMYDSVDPSAIPATAGIVAGYINGTYKWPEPAWTRFPNAIKVRIATRANVNDGHVLDVEPGAASPAQAPDWVVMRRTAGVIPSVYCNQLNGWSTVRQAFRNAGVAEPPYWVARYDNVRIIPVGAIAKQYANPPFAGGHFDLSVVADHWPGVDMGDGMTPQDEQIVIETARRFQGGIGGVREAGDLYLLLLDLRERLTRIPGVVDQAAIAIIEAVNAQPELRAQAVADALGPDLAAQVFDYLKARL